MADLNGSIPAEPGSGLPAGPISGRAPFDARVAGSLPPPGRQAAVNAALSGVPDPRDWLAAIIEGSNDAIISKDLHGIIQSWNEGATRLFGYAPEEVIGKSVTILIPPARLDEEPRILAAIQQGRRILPFETQRLRKNGELVDISLTISPIHDAHGTIVGASKIARDITERRNAQEQQKLLMGEMHHRVKNLFALANAIVAISSRAGGTLEDTVGMIQDRLQALARAHELTMGQADGGHPSHQQTELLALIHAILAPYLAGERIFVEGDECLVGGRAVTHIALLLNELATNAAKYGALSVPEGQLIVRVERGGHDVRLRWEERGGALPAEGDIARAREGFGTRLEKGVAATLKASIDRDWRADGLFVSIAVPRTALES
ncbi:PAS domain S-box protein [Sphingopyxis flava]|uniref:histidine kinase n=1 Tax=Sphingopyxis flava TaxID=1507287 RepID=A0A1T5DSC7_9SPHN|nr:PAS domain S-box protein [Sphingopyxis flava]SKB74682.1 PAS domain S-box-containing protein [Sphingopyxis flava]